MELHPGKSFVWVQCDGLAQPDDLERQATIRQHVMLHYLANPPDTELTIHPQASIQIATRNSNAKKQRTKPYRRPQPVASPSRRRQYLNRSPSKAITLETDRQICKAAWWHFYNPHTTKKYVSVDCINDCWYLWNLGLWEHSGDSETLRESFISSAAAKEAQVTGRDMSKEHYAHKGNAIRLFSQELNGKGPRSLVSTVFAMCLLGKAAWADEEYEIAEAHTRAAVFLVSSRIESIPGFLWMYFFWADLCTTAIWTRAPLLPYEIHPECQVPLSTEAIEEAKKRAQRNVDVLPLEEDDASSACIKQLFENFHQFALVFNERETTDMTTAMRACYEVGYLLAEMAHDEALDAAELSSNCKQDSDMSLIYCSLRLQYWGTHFQMLPQAGLQRILQQQIMSFLRNRTILDLCDRWQSFGALESLLWVLFNAALSMIGYPAAEPTKMADSLSWLRSCLKVVLDRLGFEEDSQWTESLRLFPFTNTWSLRFFHPFCYWFKTGLLAGENVTGIQSTQHHLETCGPHSILPRAQRSDSAWIYF